MPHSRGTARKLGTLVAGAIAGAVGTAAMDAALYRRYRSAGGTESFRRWESAAGVTNWEQASAPGQLGHKLVRFVTHREPDDKWARTTTNLMHWAAGIGWGVQYAIVATGSSGRSRVLALALGPVAWLSGYVVLPLAGVYKPIWEYDAHTLREDLSAHLVFGTATSAAYAALASSR